MQQKQQQQHIISLIINTVGLFSNLWVFYCVHYVYPNPYADGFGGHFQYLTILGLTSATLAFFLNVLRFFIPGLWPELHEVIVNIATPLEGLICLMYWAMVALDPELLIPHDVPAVPVIVDCALHLYPAIILWTDFLLFNTDFKRSLRHVAVIYGFAACYYAWSLLCWSRNGFWPYPFLGELSDVVRPFFYLFCGTICWVIYEAGAYAHQKLHAHNLNKKLS